MGVMGRWTASRTLSLVEIYQTFSILDFRFWILDFGGSRRGKREVGFAGASLTKIQGWFRRDESRVDLGSLRQASGKTVGMDGD